MEQLDSYCIADDRNASDLGKSWQGSILIANDQTELRDKMSKYPPEEGMMLGTPETLTERIREYADAGASYFMFHFQDDVETRPLELFADRVMTNF